MKKAKLFFSALFVLLGVTLLAQNVQVSGVVRERAGDVVPGAAVQLKGSTTVYAMTDALGNFRISVPSNGTLVVSCLGFHTVEIPVSGRSVIDVTLETDTEMLEETIVVAYGTVRREANTGSVSSVRGAELATTPATSIDKMRCAAVLLFRTAGFHDQHPYPRYLLHQRRQRAALGRGRYSYHRR